MDDLIGNILTWAILFGGSQLIVFIIDLIAWAVRKKHPARVEKSENISYPQYLTVYVWHDSHRSHGYKKITYIRKGNNKYRKYLNLSAGGWITKILLYLFCLVVIFALPVAVLFKAPDYPHHVLLFGYSLIVLFIFLHVHLTGPDTIARIELNKYLDDIITKETH